MSEDRKKYQNDVFKFIYEKYQKDINKHVDKIVAISNRKSYYIGLFNNFFEAGLANEHFCDELMSKDAYKYEQRLWEMIFASHLMKIGYKPKNEGEEDVVLELIPHDGEGKPDFLIKYKEQCIWIEATAPSFEYVLGKKHETDIKDLELIEKPKHIKNVKACCSILEDDSELRITLNNIDSIRNSLNKIEEIANKRRQLEVVKEITKPLEGNTGFCTPDDILLAKWTGAFQEKNEQLVGRSATESEKAHVGYKERNIVEEDDCYVIAVNGANLGNASRSEGKNGYPYAVSAVFGLGGITIPWGKNGAGSNEAFIQYKGFILNASSAEIRTDYFLNEEYKYVSAVIGCMSLYPQNDSKVVLVHNPNAVNPLPLHILGADEEYGVTLRENDFILRRMFPKLQ